MTHGGIVGSMTVRFDDVRRLMESTAVRYNDSQERNERWVNRNESEQEFDEIRRQPLARPDGNTKTGRIRT